MESLYKENIDGIPEEQVVLVDWFEVCNATRSLLGKSKEAVHGVWERLTAESDE